MPVVAPPVQVPLSQVWPAPQAWPHVPQLLVLDDVSRQVPLQFCWPATVQPHVPFVQAPPVGQTAQPDPQCPESVVELQDMSLHITLPPEHDDEHWPLSQTCPSEHTAQVEPQWAGVDWTH